MPCVSGDQLSLLDTSNSRTIPISLPLGKWHFDLTPQMSPNGRHLAYAVTDSGERHTLRVVGADGTGDSLLGEVLELYGWSSDSRWILARDISEDAAAGSYLIAFSVPDGSKRRIASVPVGRDERFAVFSPDGAHVVYEAPVVPGSSRAELRILDVETGNGRQLFAKTGEDVRLVGWHRTGWLLFTQSQSGPATLFRVRMRGDSIAGNPEKIYKDIARRAVLGRDDHVHYRTRSRVANIYEASLDETGMALTGKPALVGANFEGRTGLPTYAPDGETLAYVVDFRGPQPSIVMRTVATGDERERRAPFDAISHMKWWPDSSALLVYGKTPGKLALGLYRLNVATWEVTPVLEGPAVASGGALVNPTLMRDAKSVLFARRNEAMRMDVLSGSIASIFSADGDLRAFVLSPDGKNLAVRTRKDGQESIIAVPLNGGAPSVLLKFQPGEPSRGYPNIDFTGDGTGLLFVRTPSDANSRTVDYLYVLRLKDGSERRLLDTGMIQRVAAPA
ncbi:MAG: hypothetical protein AAB403_22255, partial [Planctomycetota bacterium]